MGSLRRCLTPILAGFLLFSPAAAQAEASLDVSPAEETIIISKKFKKLKKSDKFHHKKADKFHHKKTGSFHHTKRSKLFFRNFRRRRGFGRFGRHRRF